MSGDLTGPEWQTVLDRGRQLRMKPGEMVFAEGSRGTQVYALRQGRAKVFTTTRAGREVILAVKGPGNLLGEMAALDGQPRSASAVALDEVIAVSLTADAFQAFLDEHPRHSVHLLRVLVTKVREAAQLQTERETVDLTVRVAQRLVQLAERFGEHNGDGVEVALPLSQSDLASWVGATRESTARVLAKLRADGFVATARQRVSVVDLDGLRSVSLET